VSAIGARSGRKRQGLGRGADKVGGSGEARGTSAVGAQARGEGRDGRAGSAEPWPWPVVSMTDAIGEGIIGIERGKERRTSMGQLCLLGEGARDRLGPTGTPAALAATARRAS
jgi:hypothetical protein